MNSAPAHALYLRSIGIVFIADCAAEFFSMLKFCWRKHIDIAIYKHPLCTYMYDIQDRLYCPPIIRFICCMPEIVISLKVQP